MTTFPRRSVSDSVPASRTGPGRVVASAGAIDDEIQRLAERQTVDWSALARLYATTEISPSPTPVPSLNSEDPTLRIDAGRLAAVIVSVFR
jgi:hypothetical protein